MILAATCYGLDCSSSTPSTKQRFILHKAATPLAYTHTDKVVNADRHNEERTGSEKEDDDDCLLVFCQQQFDDKQDDNEKWERARIT